MIEVIVEILKKRWCNLKCHAVTFAHFWIFSVFLLNRGILNLIYYVKQNKSLSEVFPAIKGTNASGKLKNRYHVTPSRFLILVYNLLIKSKREYFWFQLQSLKLYNGVHAVRSLYFLKISMLLVKIQNVTPSRFQNCNTVSFS